MLLHDCLHYIWAPSKKAFNAITYMLILFYFSALVLHFIKYIYCHVFKLVKISRKWYGLQHKQNVMMVINGSAGSKPKPDLQAAPAVGNGQLCCAWEEKLEQHHCSGLNKKLFLLVPKGKS